MSPEEFLEFLKEKYDPKYISCGFNYRFGKMGQGDTYLLKKFCADNGIELKIAEPVKVGDDIVSSTFIRNLLSNGDVGTASSLLSESFSFTATVIEGDKRGRTIGFPTINQRYPEELVKLRFGVYKTKIEIDNNVFYGITDIGIRPTYKSDYVISETFIKDFSGDLYGKTLRIIPIKFLRDEKKFSSLEELKRQIEFDINA